MNMVVGVQVRWSNSGADYGLDLGLPFMINGFEQSRRQYEPFTAFGKVACRIEQWFQARSARQRGKLRKVQVNTNRAPSATLNHAYSMFKPGSVGHDRCGCDQTGIY